MKESLQDKKCLKYKQQIVDLERRILRCKRKETSDSLNDQKKEVETKLTLLEEKKLTNDEYTKMNKEMIESNIKKLKEKIDKMIARDYPDDGFRSRGLYKLDCYEQLTTEENKMKRMVPSYQVSDYYLDYCSDRYDTSASISPVSSLSPSEDELDE